MNAPPLAPPTSDSAAPAPIADDMLDLPIHRQTTFLLAGPHYPENFGACCRAIKTMGFTKIAVVGPSRLAVPSHPMARKMAVKSLDVLDASVTYENLDEAVVGTDIVVATSARRGLSGIQVVSKLAAELVEAAERKKRICLVFGNEKSGLSNEELSRADRLMRIPIAAEQPSLNLAQAVQVVAYEMLSQALQAREVSAADGSST